ncbi:MAG: hypothetical protein UY32_C0011G0010 [Candidatus Jorgensenbacteria bacterium GW2011_GWC1_48_8]|nr:MAG: hypothetical protein UY32_C0011G0010 [Candidatus Jorgensenbacteria bacterium GW2011_GWC1_48_8]
MVFNKEGKAHKPIRIFIPEKNIIVGVYQGSLSKYDILIKYRQGLKNGKWSNIRTPKHIHWAVDLLIKMHADKGKIKKFLGFLLDIWKKTTPIKSKSDRKKILDIKNLLYKHGNKIKQYQSISQYGEYRIEFLILLAKLLMIQEKTNMADAYMFRRLLEALKRGEDIFKIVSIATHRGR